VIAADWRRGPASAQSAAVKPRRHGAAPLAARPAHRRPAATGLKAGGDRLSAVKGQSCAKPVRRDSTYGLVGPAVPDYSPPKVPIMVVMRTGA